MKANILLQWRRGPLLLALLLGGEVARAQTIDPTFQVAAVYKPASVAQALQQPDGKRLVISSQLAPSMRAGHQPAGPLTRLLANSNEPDSAFTSNTRALVMQSGRMVLLPTGKILLISYGTLTLGTVSRQHLLLLNADGTADAGFNANLAVGPNSSISNPVINAVGQPDGKLVLVCTARFGTAVGPGLLVRLLPDGSLDTAFQTALNNSLSGYTRVGSNVVLQLDGKLVVPGSFGLSCAVRLLPTGALDNAFNPQLLLPTTTTASQVSVQPDGKVLIALASTSTSNGLALVRLTTTGAVDPTFQSSLTFFFGSVYTGVQVQSDGKLLVNAAARTNLGVYTGGLTRLLPDGALDISFDTSISLGLAALSGTQLLPNGQILVIKTVGYNSNLPVDRLLLLNSTGSRDASFEPRVYAAGQVNDVVQLPNGGYLVGGNFTEINGMAAGYLAKLSAAGIPDPTFSATADEEVRSVLVQPDGKLLVGGDFEHIAGGSRVSLARLLPSGALDNGFAPPFLPTTASFSGGIRRVALLPDGRVLAAGTTRLSSTNTASEYWLRILDATTGQPNLSFPNYEAQDMVVQPNGKVVVAGLFLPMGGSYGTGYCVFRLLPSGSLDPAFTSMAAFRAGLGGGPVITSLTQDAGGRLVCTGFTYTDVSLPGPHASLYSMQADGTGSISVASNQFQQVLALAVQPNGRVLVGADLSSATSTYGLSRVLSTLASDPSFISANGPTPTVNRILVQPDGAIMVAGSFASVGGQAIGGLVRLRDSNVLSVNNQQLAARTQAWPVPAHGQLHLALDAASRPQRVELLDALGRVVLAQATGQAELTLDTSALSAGAYVLRVQYASGPVARRVVVE